MKKRGLGRGLDVLLGIQTPDPYKQEHQNHSGKRGDGPHEGVLTESLSGETKSDHQLTKLPIQHLQPGQFQPRQDMKEEALEELAKSIQSQGIIQPIVVRQLGKDTFEIIAGERRWRAAKKASLTHVPVVIRQLTDEMAIAMSLIENIQREDLNPIEEAMALQRLQQEFQLTQQQVADAVGRSRASVANLLRLIALPEAVKLLIAHGDIEMGHARALLALPTQSQSQAARQVVDQGLSVRQTEAKVRQWQTEKKSDANASPTFKVDPDIQRLETRLSEKLGAKVQIKHSAKGRGQLIIAYHSVEELQGILSHWSKT